jgi:hypothetical protein
LSPYFRTFCPRKSKPSEMCVILVFSCEFKTPLGEECLDARFDFTLQQFF